MNQYKSAFLAVTCAAALIGSSFCPAEEEPQHEPHVISAQQTISQETHQEPETRDDIPLDHETQLLLLQTCEEMGVEYELALAVIWKETLFQNIMGDNGESYGYFQVQKKWHEARMERLGVTDLNDPLSNFRVGLEILAEMVDSYDGNVEMALVAFNMGPTGARKNCFDKGVYHSEYSRDVLKKYEELKEEKL